MTGNFFAEWIELALRWTHLTVGIAWIGASFYFNWLENRLERDRAEAAGIEGDLWAIHGGGFYHVQKYAVAPEHLPPQLHWFKWEAYFTWFTGLALLAWIFYLDASLFLLDPTLNDLSPIQGTVIGVLTLVGSWVVYDGMCRSFLRDRPRWLGALIFIWFAVLAFVLCQLFSGRGAYIHVGAAIGTVMVLNVMVVIIPSQKSLVNAMKTAAERDAALGQAALTRSRHNNYLTLPVLFMMIASHYPSTFGSSWNWLILIALGVVGILIRHFFNIRHLAGMKWWLPASACALFILIAALSIPKSMQNPNELKSVTMDTIRGIIHERCTVCHSATPVQPGFAAAPGGVVLDSDSQIETMAARIYSSAVATRSMPIGNVSAISEEERQMIAAWYTQTIRSGQSQPSQ
ncbi:MAG: urate hydroxylase PuuD [Acidiferrobacterales bacterium]|nr:urate hydroxylase PuuD [Acidiferrobacterales bacterium]